MSPALDVVLALDFGTNMCKGALYSSEGRCLALESGCYPLHQPAPLVAEQQPCDYLQSARRVCRKLASEAKRLDAVLVAIGLSTQTPTLVFCDEAGKALAPAIIWQDSRAMEEAEWLLREIDLSRRAKWFGLDLPISAAATPAKLLWMKKHAADIWQRTRWVIQPKDFVAQSLAGRWVTDRWCAKGIAHFDTGQVHPEYLNLLGKEASPCPPVLSPSAISGRVTSKARREWCLPAGIPVTVGWSDALAGILATGSLHREKLGFVIAGTSEIVGLSRQACEQATGLYRVPGDILEIRGLELHYGPIHSGGSCLVWLSKLFDQAPEKVIAKLDARSTLGPTSIIFRPYLYGERAPYWDHNLTASFEGLRGDHTAGDVVYAVLQGVAMQERLVLETAERGATAQAVILAGGGSRDSRWNQLRADVLQRRMIVLNDRETSLRGAALLAWGAIDPDFLKAPPDSWFAGNEILPDFSLESFYRELMERFKEV